MVLLNSSICEYGKKMPNFFLKNVDGKFYSDKDLCGENGTLIFFICNHCPYVKAIIDRLVATSKELKKYNINSVAIMPNDTKKYPEDSFEKMFDFSKKNFFDFPYLIDESQKIAKLFDAVCTPDFFGYNKKKNLQYRGRISMMKELEFVDQKNDLLNAMIQISKTGEGPKKQYPSSGCSIKWK